MNVSSKLQRLLMDLNELKGNALIHSAVIVLHEQISDSLILTQRSDKLHSHPGEVCFPGGLWEEGDDTFYSTALRELHEELCIGAERVTLIKELEIETTRLGRIIHPWFARIESVNPYQLNLQEVTRLITIPMLWVQDPLSYRDIQVEYEGMYFKTCEFTVNKDNVWGATARIMRQLSK